jgi:RimJ/RimL family protein N-acetyltransferase
MSVLHTERLTLRLPRESDFDAYAAMCADAEVMRYIGDGNALSRTDAWRNLALVLGHWQLRGYGLWAVELRETGEFIGRIGCWNPEGWPAFEIGWMLRREFWGRGYATEGARAAIRYAFTELDQPRVISLIRDGNEASVRVAQRLGEAYEGRTEVMGREAMVYSLANSSGHGS